MKWIVFNIILMFLSISVFSAATKNIKTEDLGGIKKPPKRSKKLSKKTAQNEVKKAEIQKPQLPVQNNKTVAPPVELPGSKETKETAPFYKSLGAITIRAKEDYVYIRAGKSAVIMDASGKILIDSDKDLIISSNQDLILKAKRDIIIKPGGQLQTPETAQQNGSDAQSLSSKSAN